MTVITSSANAHLKEIRKLRDRKYRTETSLAWVEGLRACGDAFSHPEIIQQVVVCPESLHSSFADELLQKAHSQKIDVLEVNKDAYATLSGKDRPQGMGVIIRQTFRELNEVNLNPGDLWVALDRVADPGNLGTILRTLDACGGKGLFLLDQCTDPYDPTAIRASTGAVFHLDLVKTDTLHFSAWKKSSTCSLVGAVAVPGAKDYHSHHYSNPLILIMGSEREGLTPNLTQLCDSLVSIPMIGHVDSLNLAEATAIMLYEIFNQRREMVLDKGDKP
jgi:RNA methyltransferase, TrmH family